MKLARVPFRKLSPAITLSVLAWLASEQAAWAAATEGFCIRNLQAQTAPNINGDPSEAFWTQATSVTPNDGLDIEQFWLASNDGGFYVAGSFDNTTITDSIVLVLGISTRAEARKFVIYPFASTDVGSGVFSNRALLDSQGHPSVGQSPSEWWSDKTTWNNPNTKTTLASTNWLSKGTNFAYSKSGANSWKFEMLIPRAAGGDASAIDGLGDDNTPVGFYINLITTTAPSNLSYKQFRWPQNADTSITNTGDDVDTLMPPKPLPAGGALVPPWGQLTLDNSSACGVSLAYSGIGVLRSGTVEGDIQVGKQPVNADPVCSTSNRQGNADNMLIAKLESTHAGTVKVNVDFTLIPYGIGGPGTGIHVTPGVTDVNLGENPVTKNWNEPRTNLCQVLGQAGGHYCFKAELTHPSGDTSANILTPSIQRNLYWSHASSFTHDALIDTRGLPPPPSGTHEILLRVFTDVLSDNADAALHEQGITPPICSPADPRSGSERCKCLLDAENHTGPILIPGTPGTTSPIGTAVVGRAAQAVVIGGGDGAGGSGAGPSGCDQLPDTPKGPYQTLRKTVRATLLMDSTISIHGQKYREERDWGSYTYFVRHFLEDAGPDKQVGWQLADLSAGATLKRLDSNPTHEALVRTDPKTTAKAPPELYLLELPVNGSTHTTTQLLAADGPLVPPCTGGCCRCTLQRTSSGLTPLPALGAALGLAFLMRRARRASRARR